MNVRIQHPGLPDGYELSITGLNAILLNNQDVEVDDEAIAHYESVTGKKFADTLNSPSFTGVHKQKETKLEEGTPADPPNDPLNDPPNGAGE